MKYIVIAIILIMTFQSCAAQNIMKPCKDTFEVDVENSGLYEGASLMKDSMLKKIDIVFEQNFNDSISIFCGNKITSQKKIETNRRLGVSTEIITIDYSDYKETPKVSIILKNKNDCISFYPIRGKRMAYVNRINGAWSVELSNVIREYR